MNTEKQGKTRWQPEPRFTWKMTFKTVCVSVLLYVKCSCWNTAVVFCWIIVDIRTV